MIHIIEGKPFAFNLSWTLLGVGGLSEKDEIRQTASDTNGFDFGTLIKSKAGGSSLGLTSLNDNGAYSAAACLAKQSNNNAVAAKIEISDELFWFVMVSDGVVVPGTDVVGDISSINQLMEDFEDILSSYEIIYEFNVKAISKFKVKDLFKKTAIMPFVVVFLLLIIAGGSYYHNQKENEKFAKDSLLEKMKLITQQNKVEKFDELKIVNLNLETYTPDVLVNRIINAFPFVDKYDKGWKSTSLSCDYNGCNLSRINISGTVGDLPDGMRLSGFTMDSGVVRLNENIVPKISKNKRPPNTKVMSMSDMYAFGGSLKSNMQKYGVSIDFTVGVERAPKKFPAKYKFGGWKASGKLKSSLDSFIKHIKNKNEFTVNKVSFNFGDSLTWEIIGEYITKE